jgi:DNA-binding NarL/FixJ family response regulator
LEFIQIVGTARNGELALQKAQALSPDLILMDLEMVGMNGLESASRLKELMPETLVIIVTVHDNPEVELACRAAGAVGFIPKSRAHLDLADEIRRLFMGSGPANS